MAHTATISELVLDTTYNLHQRYLICCQIAKNKHQLPITFCWLTAEFPVFNPVLPELVLVRMLRWSDFYCAPVSACTLKVPTCRIPSGSQLLCGRIIIFSLDVATTAGLETRSLLIVKQSLQPPPLRLLQPRGSILLGQRVRCLWVLFLGCSDCCAPQHVSFLLLHISPGM